MKRILIIFALTLAVASVSAQIKWHTFTQAQELCKQHPKKIFIDVYTDWCGWCKVYDNNTFSDSSIAAYVNKHYYAVKFNAEGHDTIHFMGYTLVNPSAGARSTHQLAMALLNGKLSYPTVVFMNEKFQLLHVQSGYLKPDQLAPFLVYLGEDLYEKENNMPFDEFMRTFKWPLPNSKKL